MLVLYCWFIYFLTSFEPKKSGGTPVNMFWVTFWCVCTILMAKIFYIFLFVYVTVVLARTILNPWTVSCLNTNSVHFIQIWKRNPQTQNARETIIAVWTTKYKFSHLYHSIYYILLGTKFVFTKSTTDK